MAMQIIGPSFHSSPNEKPARCQSAFYRVNLDPFLLKLMNTFIYMLFGPENYVPALTPVLSVLDPDDSRWVAVDDWEYSTHFSPPAGFAGPGRVVLLECDGLDTIVSLYLNGHLIGNADNMFRKYQFDVTAFLGGQNSSNSLVLQFTSAVSYAKQKAQNYPYELPTSDTAAQHGEPFRNLIRKEQSSFSWDWGPCFITQGVWRSIKLISYSSARMESAGISVAKEQKPQSKRWIVTASVEISALAQASATISVRLVLKIRMKNNCF